MNRFFLVVLLVFLFSCENTKESISLDFNELRNKVLELKQIKDIKTPFYTIVISENNDEKDIWISSENKNIFDSILTYYNEHFVTDYSDSVINSWTTDSNNILLYKQSDTNILISMYKN